MILTTPNTINNAYVVYKIYNTKYETLYIGSCKLNRLAEIPDAARNPMFKYIIKPDQNIMIEILFTCNNRVDCYNLKIAKLYEMSELPILNSADDNKNLQGLPIKCVETGEIFRTLKEVAEAHGVTIPALSNHLRKQPKYNTVKGKTYIRGLEV